MYHVGVWQAVQELGLGVSGLVGTSIGALAAAAMAMGSDDTLEALVGALSLESMVSLPKSDQMTLDTALALVQSVVARKGLDTTPLRRLLTDRIDEAVIRSSGLDFGLVTVNLSDLAPRELFLDQMDPGSLIDYLMATTAFPGFESPRIDGKRYLDGGLYDNIPFDLARRRGYRRILVSDVSGVGITRKTDPAGTITASVRNSIRMGGVFDFDPVFLADYRRLGYLDTLKTFGRLGGQHYFLESGSAADPVLEAAALMVEVPRIAVYTAESLAEAVEARRKAVEARVAELAGDESRDLAALLRTSGALLTFAGPPYQTWRLLEELFPGRGGDALRSTLARLHPPLRDAAPFFSSR